MDPALPSTPPEDPDSSQGWIMRAQNPRRLITGLALLVALAAWPGENGTVSAAATDLPPASALAELRDTTGESGSGGALVAYRAGGRRVSGEHGGKARLFRTGAQAFEPTLGIAPDGFIYTNTKVGYAGTSVLRTRDGAAFKDVGPKIGGQSTDRYTQDPYLHVDPSTGRVFRADLLLPCQRLSWSDDRGETWRSSVSNCEQGDHQTLFAGPAPKTAVQPSGYRNVLYNCAISGGSFAGTTSTATSCSKSLDGGQTFLPTGGGPIRSIRAATTSRGRVTVAPARAS